jgi:ParB family chromosome partitioning protein
MKEQITPYRTPTFDGLRGQDDRGALFGIDAENGISEKPLENEGEGAFFLVPMSRISVARTLSRQHFSKDALERLAESIKKDGMLQPIVVGRDQNGRFFVMAGIRRWLAAKSVGLKKVPCVLKTGEPILVSLTENTVREDLSPVEQAEALSHAMRVMGLNQKELAEEIGKSTTAVNDILRLNGLPEAIKEKCRNSNDYSRSALLNIVRLKGEERMLAAFKKIEKKESIKTGGELHQKGEPDGQNPKHKPRDPKDIFIVKLKSTVSAAKKIDKGSISKNEMSEILSCLQKMEVMMKQLSPKKSRVRDFLRWLKPSRWF